jgi:hypothetical protein
LYDQTPFASARPTTPAPKVPGNISGKRVIMSKCIFMFCPLAIVIYSDKIASKRGMGKKGEKYGDIERHAN